MNNVCVFCGGNPGVRPSYAAAARALGAELVSRGLGLVYGGAQVGLMGVVADAVLSGGGRVFGVIPVFLSAREIAHGGLSELRVVATMHERKALMADNSEAFVALPGGYGTLDEMFEILTWGQLGLHRKPCGLLNVDGYFDGLLAYLDRSVEEGFLKPEYRSLLSVGATPKDLLDKMLAQRVPPGEGWMKSTDQA